jgi:hypothetical protein
VQYAVVAGVQSPREPLRVEQVRPDETDVLRDGCLVAFGEVVEDRYLVALLQKLQGDDATDIASSAGDEELQEITSGPSSVRMKVSSAFAPVMEGFQAKACPACISCKVSGPAMISRAA